MSDLTTNTPPTVVRDADGQETPEGADLREQTVEANAELEQRSVTASKETEIQRLMREDGLTEAQATAVVTAPQLDLPLGPDGTPVVPLPNAQPIKLPPPLLPPEE